MCSVSEAWHSHKRCTVRCTGQNAEQACTQKDDHDDLFLVSAVCVPAFPSTNRQKRNRVPQVQRLERRGSTHPSPRLVACRYWSASPMTHPSRILGSMVYLHVSSSEKESPMTHPFRILGSMVYLHVSSSEKESPMMHPFRILGSMVYLHVSSSERESPMTLRRASSGFSTRHSCCLGFALPRDFLKFSATVSAAGFNGLS